MILLIKALLILGIESIKKMLNSVKYNVFLTDASLLNQLSLLDKNK